jgi:hypothetical protein
MSGPPLPKSGNRDILNLETREMSWRSHELTFTSHNENITVTLKVYRLLHPEQDSRADKRGSDNLELWQTHKV